MAKKNSNSLKGKSFDSGTLSKISAAIGDKNLTKKITDLGGKITSGGGGASSNQAPQLTYAPGSLETMTVAQAQAAGRGQEYANMVAGFGYGTPTSPSTVRNTSGWNPTTQNYNTPITTKDMMGLSTVDTKTPPPPTPDYVMGYDKAADAAVKAGMQAQTDLAQRESDTAKLYKDYLKEEPERVEVPRELERAKETALKQANEIKSQIDMINAQLQSNLMQLRQTGSVEGVTEAVYGGQQLQLNREAAIKLMPLTATYQAAVDNYNAAKEIVSDWVTQENAYLDRYQSWKNGIFEKAFSYAVGKEEQALEEARFQENKAIDARKDRLSRIDKYYSEALDAGDKATAQSIAKLVNQVDSPTFDDVFASTVSRINPQPDGSLTTRQNINLSSITTKYQADEVIKAAQSAISAKELAQNVLNNPTDAGAQLTTLYTFIKALDPNSAVREGELSLVNSTQSYLSRFSNEISKIANNRAISPESAKQLANETIKLADQWRKSAERRDNFYKSQANVLGVGSYFDDYLTGTKGAGVSNSPSSNESSDPQFIKWLKDNSLWIE
jgi:hypothetical protein